MSNLSVDTLFHFTDELKWLAGIVEKGFIPRYCLEHQDGDMNTVDLLSPTYTAMVCFCDIPLEHISNYTSMYGKYGIGLRKDWGIERGVNPVMYFNNESYFINLLGGDLTMDSSS